MKSLRVLATWWCFLAGCDRAVVPVTPTATTDDVPESRRDVQTIAPENSTVQRSDSAIQDNSPKGLQRLVPTEVYVRALVRLFGAPSPAETATAANALDGLEGFDGWEVYLSMLGLPDSATNRPRATQTNTLMSATFDRLAILLCNRAVERELRARMPLAERRVFAFDLPAGTALLDADAFGVRFDVVHRAFLSYPVALAPADRSARFFRLYRDVAAMHTGPTIPAQFTPAEAGWATVCYGLARHPEFLTY
jgi:hypothetical protein